MAINGIELQVGQVWRTRGGWEAEVFRTDGDDFYPWDVRSEGRDDWSVRGDGRGYEEDGPSVDDLITPISGPGIDPEPVPASPAPALVAPSEGITAVLEERGSRYGKFTTHAEVTQTLKAVIKSKMGAKWGHLADDQKEALEMIAHKLGRIINGDPNYGDSWTDIAGYAKLVADRLEGVER